MTATITEIPTPQAWLAQKMDTPLLQCEGTLTGEGPAWYAAYKTNEVFDLYAQTGDVAYLESARAFFNALIEKMHTSPDGYRGWVGYYIGNETWLADVVIGDAILFNPMLKFAELVLHDQPEKLSAFADQARDYIDLVEVHHIQKYQSRGTWWENGPYGGYFVWDKALHKDDLTTFVPTGQPHGGIGYQFNKQQSIGISHLRLYRLTGSDDHREKAERIFNHLKSRLTLVDDYYTWNYWEPFMPSDVASVDPPELRLWTQTHPFRNYQNAEVSEAVEAFHSGVTFDETDIKRFINTNKRIMWNGDTANPQWRNSNADVHDRVYGENQPQEPKSEQYPTKAGALWPSLGEFDHDLAELAGTTAHNTAFERKYDLPVKVFPVDYHHCETLCMAHAIPQTLAAGDTNYLISKARLDGELSVEVYDGDGAWQCQLFKGRVPGGADGTQGIHVLEYTNALEPGDYRIRWTLNGQYREYAIVVTQ